MSSKYFSGQGKVFIAEVVNGVAGPLRSVGNTPMLKFDLKVKTLEHQESTSGQRLTDFRLDQGSTASITADLEEFTPENLARVLRGAPVTIAAGSVTAEALPAGLVAGDFVALKKTNVSSVVVKDSAGTPATLVAGTDYVLNEAHGSLQILNVGTYVQPFKVDYANGPAVSSPMFTAGRKTYFVRFEGLNTANDDKPVLVEFYKFQMDPAGLELISDNMSKFTINGTALYDDTKPKDGELGQFGRVVQIG
jgi:hypothetical protein